MRGVWKLPAPQLSSEPLIRRILASRGIDEPDFLSPSLLQLHDPVLLPGINAAAERILLGLQRNQRIVIYADYDVDGVSAAAILWYIFRAIAPGAAVSTYLPHRLEEGYGLNGEAIAHLCDGNDLIVSVDCGVTAVTPARVARERGIDLIITDHHTPPLEPAGLPKAHSIVHPSVPGQPPYPFPHLCGAGVAFKLAWRLATLVSGGERASPEFRKLLVELLALAAMGVIADVVPLRGENRVIAKFGLDQIRRSSLVGVRALRDESKLGGDDVDASDVGFRLGPRLNAIGRLGHAREALELLTTDDEARAMEIARSLTRWNDERRKTEAEITQRAESLAIERGMTAPEHRAIVLSDPDWHRGVVGICCSRLVGKFYRPTLLLQRDGDLCHGSGRSIDGFDLHAALAHCADLLESFGGHTMAAGLKIRTERVDEFTRRFVAFANERLKSDDLVRTLRADAECRLRELDLTSAEELHAMSPFGRDNEKPCVLVRGATLLSPPRMLGQTGKHLVFDLRQDNAVMRVKAWNWAEAIAPLSLRPGVELELLLAPEINAWNGRRSVECTLEDLRLTGIH
ncbi:MAG: single-stranded-DNA-specific exonuclease RecJ [Phycisphaerales bacterium]